MNPLKHVAIIMDGNGRWGLKHKKSRNAGHKAGLNTVEKIINETIKKKQTQNNAFANSYQFLLGLAWRFLAWLKTAIFHNKILGERGYSFLVLFVIFCFFGGNFSCCFEVLLVDRCLLFALARATRCRGRRIIFGIYFILFWFWGLLCFLD